mmetsp:Transcript_38103/g.44366  ORF Transcript_38103/g.44366 Transcript_38103/m.44366 type:complete len:109 (+) Transcript_38103:394-720(+)
MLQMLSHLRLQGNSLSSTLPYLVFWNLVIRGENELTPEQNEDSMETVKSPVAGTETNIGGHTTDSLAEFIVKKWFDTNNSITEESVSCLREDIAKALDSGCCFAIINF